MSVTKSGLCVIMNVCTKRGKGSSRKGSDIMSKKEKNNTIIKLTRNKITRLGLKGKLDIYPVENTFTRRPRYWRDSDGVALFKVHMWDLNELSGKTLADAIDARIDAARVHFGI